MPDAYRWPVPGRYAVLNPESPRAAEWQTTFGGLVIPVRSMHPRWAQGPKGPVPALQLDALKLPQIVLNQVIRVYARKAGTSLDWALCDLLGPVGLMILADDLMTCTDPAEGIAAFAPSPTPAPEGGAS